MVSRRPGCGWLKQREYSFRLTAMGWYEDFRWVTYYE